LIGWVSNIALEAVDSEEVDEGNAKVAILQKDRDGQNPTGRYQNPSLHCRKFEAFDVSNRADIGPRGRLGSLV